MLCALITPSPDDLTDLGEIEPLIVFNNFIVETVEAVSLCAGIAVVLSEKTTMMVRMCLRIPKLY